LLCSPFEILRLAILFRREQIDIVHASGGSWQYKAVIAAWLINIPVVWHLNDTSSPGWVRGVFRRIQPLASGFIFASHRSQDYYGDLICPGRPQTVVPSTVDLDYFNPAIVYPLDSKLPITDQGFVIGTVANVNPIKGIETLIRAAACLENHGYKLSLVIIGMVTERQRGYLRKLLLLAEDLGLSRIHFLGEQGDVRPIMSTFDIYICSSIAESSPVAVWEAMSMARAIVSTDVGDVSRHIKNEVSGFVVQVGDYEAMADKIEFLLKDPKQRTKLGENARKAAAYFNPAAIADQSLSAYQNILDANASKKF